MIEYNYYDELCKKVEYIKEYQQEIQDLKQALVISRNMTEHYRRLLVDAYANNGLLKVLIKKQEKIIRKFGLVYEVSGAEREILNNE